MKKSILGIKALLFITLVTGLLCLSSCKNQEDKYVSKGRKAYKAYFERTLKDPSSLVIYSETYEHESIKVEFTVDMGAKNSFGAMVRETYVFEILDGKIYKVNGEFYLQ